MFSGQKLRRSVSSREVRPKLEILNSNAEQKEIDFKSEINLNRERNSFEEEEDEIEPGAFKRNYTKSTVGQKDNNSNIVSQFQRSFRSKVKLTRAQSLKFLDKTFRLDNECHIRPCFLLDEI